MKLTIIGCSGSFPGPQSPASCYMLSAYDGEREWKILLDLGSGALGAVQRYTDLRDVDAILLTHLHPDHCMDLCGLHVAIRWDPDGWGRARIPVYSPAATADRMALAYGLEPDTGMKDEFDFINWREGVPVKLGPFTITPYRANHVDEEPYLLRIECTEVLPNKLAPEDIEQASVDSLKELSHSRQTEKDLSVARPAASSRTEDVDILGGGNRVTNPIEGNERADGAGVIASARAGAAFAKGADDVDVAGGAAGPLSRTVTLCYSGDTDSCVELVEAARGVDLFLCEAAFIEGRDTVRGVHLTGKRAGEAAQDAGVKRLLLTHLPVWTDPSEIMAEAKGAYSGDAAIAIAGVHYII